MAEVKKLYAEDNKELVEALAIKQAPTIVVVENGEILAHLPLPVAGLISDKDADYVIKKGEENRNAAVTKMDAAKFIIRYLGYEDVAELDIYAPEFKDLKENKGYASILGGMGIMSGDENGNFSPDEVVKREDIAEIAVNIIER